ncbi:MAG: hypothetical protein LAT66_10055 [Alkalimonas sp.]|nr:hypothetical protein [Alkalimonas sp.]
MHCSDAELIDRAKSLIESDGTAIFVTTNSFNIRPVLVSHSRQLPDGSIFTRFVSASSQQIQLANQFKNEKSLIQQEIINLSEITINTNSFLSFSDNTVNSSSSHPLDSAHSIAGSDVAKRELERYIEASFADTIFTRADTTFAYLEYISSSLLGHVLNINAEVMITALFPDGSTYDLTLEGFTSTFFSLDFNFKVVEGSGFDSGFRIPEKSNYHELAPSGSILDTNYFNNATNAATSGLGSFHILSATEVRVCTGVRPDLVCRIIVVYR